MIDSEQKKLEASLATALGLAKNEVGAKNILAMLFPRAERALNTFITSEPDEAIRKKQRRISQKDFAENYFELSPEDDAWALSEFQNAIDGVPGDAFDQLRRKVERASNSKQSDIRRIFLELLDSEFSSPRQLSQAWLDGIIAESPYFLAHVDEETTGFFSTSNEERLRWIIVHGLRNLPTQMQWNLLRTAIGTAEDLSVLTDVVRGIIGDVATEGERNREKESGFGDGAGPLRELLLSRVVEAAGTGRIWLQAKPENLLWFWWGAGGGEQVREFIERAIATKVGLKRLLEITVSKVRSTAGDYLHVSQAWAKIVDLAKITDLAQQLIVLSKDDREVQLARRFLSALERGQNDPVP